MVVESVTEDLLARFTAHGPGDQRWAERRLLVAYVRAHHLDTTDPREFVLRPSRIWELPVGDTLGAGRAPTDVSVEVPLLEDDGEQDAAVPRLAARLAFRHDHWWITNQARGATTITLSAAGAQEELTAASSPHPLRRRRLTVTVRSRTSDAGSGVRAVAEHRLTLFAPWIPDDLPAVRPGPAVDTTTGTPGGTSDLAGEPRWSWAQQRLLAAWAYADVIGLAARGHSRGRTTRLLLRQSQVGEDPNERALTGLRRRASRELGISLSGEANTPAFLTHVVARRSYLGAALAALHAEYDRQHPPTGGIRAGDLDNL